MRPRDGVHIYIYIYKSRGMLSNRHGTQWRPFTPHGGKPAGPAREDDWMNCSEESMCRKRQRGSLAPRCQRSLGWETQKQREQDERCAGQVDIYNHL